jgi:hypothetical protein
MEQEINAQFLTKLHNCEAAYLRHRDNNLQFNFYNGKVYLRRLMPTTPLTFSVCCRRYSKKPEDNFEDMTEAVTQLLIKFDESL